MTTIPFNKPDMTSKELWYIAQAHANTHAHAQRAGDGRFTKGVWRREWIETG